jgi:hypothetical protein
MPLSKQKYDYHEIFTRPKVEFVYKSDPRYYTYFANYTESQISKIFFENEYSANSNGCYLFESGESLNHTIWIYNEINFKPVPMNQFLELSKKSDLFKEVNLRLEEAFVLAKNWRKWKHIPKGFLIEGSTNFGFEAGSFMGTRVSFNEIQGLIKSIEDRNTKEVERQQIFLASCFVHEHTHNEREEISSTTSTEIASHILQFAFEPKINHIFNHQLKYSLKKIENYINLDLYDKAQYIALIIIVSELIKNNKLIEYSISNDESTYKTVCLGNIFRLISQSDKILLSEQIATMIMLKSNSELLEMYKNICLTYKIPELVNE